MAGRDLAAGDHQRALWSRRSARLVTGRMFSAYSDPGPTWDALSRRYDRQLWLERCAVATALCLLAPAVNERLVDAGTSTGEGLRQLARRSIVPREVTGIDASRAMLARVGPLPHGWLLHVGDVRELDQPDASFDVLIASYLLQLLAPVDLTAALGELRRVLRPGGRLVTVTPAIPPSGLARPVAAALDRLAARRSNQYRGLRALNPASALERAGFRLLRSRWSLRGYPSVCVLAIRPEHGTERNDGRAQVVNQPRHRSRVRTRRVL